MGISSNGGSILAGHVVPFAGANIPVGWLACGGQAVSRSTYTGLFLALGTLYGVGDGATTFNVPDFRGRTLFGKDDMGGVAANRLTTGGGGLAGATLGAVGGGETVTLTNNELPSHNHTDSGHNHSQNAHTHTVPVFGSVVGSVGAAAGQNASVSATTAAQTATNNASNAVITATGSGAAHKNIPPSAVINYIIKT